MRALSHAPVLLLLLLALAAAGCRTPLSTVARAATGRLDALATPRDDGEEEAGPPPIPAGVEPLPEPTREEALNQILGDLQQLGAQNPAAQQELLAQLQSAEPDHWPLLVQRMRADLGYQQQLAARNYQPDVMTASAQRQPRDAPPPYQPPEPHTAPDPGPAPARARPGRAPLYDASVEAASGAAPYPATQAPGAIGRLASADASRAAPAPQPAPPRERTWREALAEAIDLLSQSAPQRPHSTDEAYDHVRLRLLHLASGDLDAATEPAPGLSTTEQEYWSNQLFTAGTLLDHSAQPETRRRAATAGMHLRRASAALEELGSLTVQNLAFCEEVYGFGAYKPHASPRFRAGQEVALYAEVRNFATETTDQGEHTSLATSYRVLDQQGARVDSGEFPVVDDHCLRRRRDFHIQYGITLPSAIYPGEYVLELTITDQLGDKIGHGSIGFEIVDGGGR